MITCKTAIQFADDNEKRQTDRQPVILIDDVSNCWILLLKQLSKPYQAASLQSSQMPMQNGQVAHRTRYLCKLVFFLVPLIVPMPPAECKAPGVNCNVMNPLPIHHKYSQPGDMIIASIMSQVYTFSSPILFNCHPSSELQDEVM